MQDMSGFVLPDIISPPLDEQLDINISTAQTENDFYVQNPGLPSPEYILGGQSEGVVSEDSDMFDYSNCDALSPKLQECPVESPIKRNLYDYEHSEKAKSKPNMVDNKRDFSSHQTTFCLHKAKLPATIKMEKPRYLAIIDSEEPFIKEDPDLLYFTQTKADFDTKISVDVSDNFNSEELSVQQDMGNIGYCPDDFKDMEVAGEVVVVTEEHEYKSNLCNISLLDSVSSDPEEEDLDITEETEKKGSDVVFQTDPFLDLESVIGDLFNSVEPLVEDDLLNSGGNRPLSTPNDLFSSSANPQQSLKPDTRSVPQLKLDIDAARTALGKGLTDTPELLDVLEPKIGKFDLIRFITTNGDPNNNDVSPATESCPQKPEAPRKGKSHLSLSDLKQAQNISRDQPSIKLENDQEENEPLPSTSGTSPSSRPARKSATRFKRMMEEGFLGSATESQSVSSDDEDDLPKAKRRRTTSTSSSRRRLNWDSDQSSVTEDAMKYRERRDRNNLSSKRSRQKRKQQFVQKEEELKKLEDENTRLSLKAEELESVLKRVKAAWNNYLAHLNDNDKDQGDEHC